MFDRRILAALEATPSRIPVLLGGCGSGRTAALLRLRDHLGRPTCQYIDIERVASTPECFLRAITMHSPFAPGAARGAADVGSARDAFGATLRFLDEARGPGGTPATFLLDEVLELRTFESFPGLRGLLRDLIGALSQSPNRFVLTTRYVARAHRLLRDASAQFEVIHVQPMTLSEVRSALVSRAPATAEAGAEELARAVHALADGRPAYVNAILDTMAGMDRQGGGDPLSALSSLMAPDGALAISCRFCYELRLHRARGYGALKAILEVLAGEEPLTLTEIALRLRRTPGSTKDYLSWLEDVDLVRVQQKRYSFTDPLLRLWVRLHCRPTPPSDEDLARGIHEYALARLPQSPAEPAMVYAGAGATRSSGGIIEID
jgi:hypothetical protein